VYILPKILSAFSAAKGEVRVIIHSQAAAAGAAAIADRRPR